MVRDSHVQRLHEFMQNPPDHFTGNVQLSMGLEGDMDFLGRGARKTYEVQTQDMGVIGLNSPHVVVLVVGGNDLCHPSTLALEVASTIHDLALSIADMEGCHWVFVASIPPRRSYPLVSPVYPERVRWRRASPILNLGVCTSHSKRSSSEMVSILMDMVPTRCTVPYVERYASAWK